MSMQRRVVAPWKLAGLVLAALVLSTAFAESTVKVAQHEQFGAHLTDGDERSLYLFTQDEEGRSACTGDCAEAWPPFTVTDEASAGDGVAESLLGTIERDDGSAQVTYNGRPLYYFAADGADAPVSGHGVNDVWFLVSPYGEAIDAPQADEPEAEASAESEGDAEPVPEDVLANGQEVYAQHCAACHGSDGGGGSGPTLEADVVEDEGDVVDQTLWGGSHMPAFGNTLADAEVAAVATYVRNSFGNDFGLTTEEEVAEAR